MGSFLIFLLNRLIFRVSNFIRHWYVSAFKIYANFIVTFLEGADKSLAFKITYRNLFAPLYGDRSIFGYVFGFIFRIWKLFFTGIFYAIIIVFAIIVFLVWCAIPLYVVYKIAYYSPAFDAFGLSGKFKF